MIDHIISFSIRNKLFIGLMTVALIVGGLYSMTKIPLDAIPDITNNQVQVITVAPNLGTEDIEQFITYQVELAMANLPGVTEIRSVSRFGLSVVTIVFEDRMKTYLPRQLVGEALIKVKENIPDGFGTPTMSPISTGLGEIYQYTLNVEKGYEDQYDDTKLRTIQDWIVKRQMAMLPGVVEVNSFGGKTKQYEVAINPDKLKSMNVSIGEVFNALQDNNQNTGGAYIEKNRLVNYIRGEGLARSVKDIENIPVKTVNGSPIFIRDIATVQFGNAVRYGAFTRNGKGEAVGGIIMMLKGENSNQVITDVKERMALIQKSLPKGITIQPFLDRSEMIKSTTSTVAENLAIGALIVIFVLVLILGNMRGGFIVATTIPLSLLFAFIMMRVFNVWANLMSLGAIDFGILVDGAVIIVESMIFYLHDKNLIGKKLLSKERDELAFKASSKMMNSAFFGQVIIMIVFIPLLALQGIEGKMFAPMALTFGFAVLGVVILCLTYIPMMSALLLQAPKTAKVSLGDKIVTKIENFYRPILDWSLRKGKIVIAGATVLLLLAGFLFSRMGGEFVPQLDEGNLAMHILMKPGTSLSEMVSTSTKIEKMLMDRFPNEIESMQTRIGVADIPTDPMPMDIGDSFIILKPISEWKAASSKDELLAKFEEAVQEIPGINYEFSQPVEMRFNELLTGIREDLAIKIYGENLDILAQKAAEIEKLVAGIPGVGDIRAEATQGLPQITVRYNREKMGLYGLKISDINRQVESAFSGASAGVIYEGEKRFDLVIRLDKSFRTNISDIQNLYVNLPNGNQLPLSEIANVSYRSGPMQISRDNTNRRTFVGINVRGRDVKSLVEEIQKTLDEKLELPAGYYIRYGGAFENLQRATSRLVVVVPIALVLIFLLVYTAIKSFKQTLMIYMAIPLSAVGGVLSLYLRDMPFSISAGVGFIVLFGVAVMNGLVLISGFNELKSEGLHSLKDIIIKGSIRRIRPIILTASTDVLGFLPMAVSTSAGAEVQRPLATVVVGGMITATVLTLIVLPILYQFVESRKHKARVNPAVLTIAILLMVVPIVLPQKAQAQKQVISIKQAIEMAKQNYPSIQAAKLGVEQQKALKPTAYDLGSTQLYTGKEKEEKSIFTDVGVGQSGIDIFGIGAKKRLIGTQIDFAEANLTLTQKEIERAVSIAYLDMIYTTQNYQLYKQIDSIYANFVKAAELRYNTQQTNKLEFLSASAKYKQLQIALRQAESQLQIARAKLNQYLMISTPYEIEIVDTFSPVNTDTLSTARNPIVNLQAQAIQVAKGAWNAEKAGYYPKLDLSYTKQLVPSLNNYYGFQVGVSVPLLFFAQKGRTKAAKIGYQIAEQNYYRAKSETDYLLKEKTNRYATLQKSLLYYKTEAIPLAEEQIYASTLAYKLGSIDYIQFIQNIESAINIKQEYLANRTELLNTEAEINYLSGN